MNRTIFYHRKLLKSLEYTDAIVGGHKVKLYRNLRAELCRMDSEWRADDTISALMLRRILVPAENAQLHFYLVKDRRQGLKVELAVQQTAQNHTSVA